MTDKELYEKAKLEYYNGTPILSDYEFDELEKKLGLENKSYVGTKHSPSYTIKHPFIMGSLSKVQIKESKDGSIDWQKYLDQIKSYVGTKQLIITPKYDGCSFEMVYGNGIIQTVSSRGDGTFGRDISKPLNQYVVILQYPCCETFGMQDAVLRGEVLIGKDVFEKKYSDFVNPRSFVSGILNRDYDENDKELLSAYKDISIIIYDIRVKENGQWVDKGWYQYKNRLPYMPSFWENKADCTNTEQLECIYREFEEYRNTMSNFALDGIVFKPIDSLRENNTTLARPKDCVAIKFVPMLQETEVEDIEWNLGKTGELFPTVFIKPVIMDGKVVSRVSGNNYGYIKDNKLGKGTKLVVSLAGDIIPFIYKVTNTSTYNESGLEQFNSSAYKIDGCHLYRCLSKEEKDEQLFLESAHSLAIDGIGDSAAKTIYDYLKEQAQGDAFLSIEPQEVPTNILCTTGAEIRNALGGKLGANAEKAYNKYKSAITLEDVIVSCNFTGCGRKIAQEVAKQILFGNGNFEHLSEKAYKWCFEPNSVEWKYLDSVLMKCGKTLDIFKSEYETISTKIEGQIPIIMTGEPNNYTSKSDFMNKHPEYRETGSWKEVKIVFTNSLDSTTSKMKKAKDKGITIALY